jgi:hypothetical protein
MPDLRPVGAPAVRAKQGANQDGLGRTKADFSVRASRCLAGGIREGSCADTEEVTGSNPVSPTSKAPSRVAVTALVSAQSTPGLETKYDSGSRKLLGQSYWAV